MRKQIFNFQFSIFNFKEKGYTLIELLAVLVILIVIGSIIVAILVSTLRGNNRSITVNYIRQNGNTAITQMAKMISFAQDFEGVSTGVQDIDGNIIFTTACTQTIPPFPTPPPTPVLYSYIKIKSFDGAETVFSCPDIAANGVPLIEASNISVTSCNFTCTQNNLTSPPTIGISFTLSRSGGSLLVENNVSIPFQTSVVPRNY